MGRGISYALVCLMAGVPACGADFDPCAQPSAGTVCELAGDGELAFNGDGKPAKQSAMYLPSEVRRGPDGLVYIMDYNNHRLRRIEADGTMSTVAGNGFHAGAQIGMPATQSSLENPIDFDWLPDGRIVFIMYHDPRVVAIGADGTLQLIAGDGTVAILPDQADGTPVDQAEFIELAGIVVAPDGRIFVADDQANRVRVIHDGVVDTYAGAGGPAYRGDSGPAKLAALNGPNALALDGAGDLFISDGDNCVVRKIVPDGTITTVAGSGISGFLGDAGLATSAELAHPAGIAAATDGTLYIADRANERLRSVAPDGTITTIAGTGDRGYKGDGGPALDAEFDFLARIQLDEDGGLLIADQANSRVRKLTQ
jgi:hypothetical protein